MLRNNIFDEMVMMQKEMERLFGHVCETGCLPDKTDVRKEANAGLFRIPTCDICETESAYVAALELPGVDKKDITLDVKQEALTVKVVSENTQDTSCSSQRFFRRIPLPRNTDVNKASAQYENGMLRINIPKRINPETKRIEIE